MGFQEVGNNIVAEANLKDSNAKAGSQVQVLGRSAGK